MTTQIRRPGATVAGIFSVAFGSVLLLCGAGLTPTGTVQKADLNANGFSITNAATISATNFAGNGAGLTNLAPVAPIITLTFGQPTAAPLVTQGLAVHLAGVVTSPTTSVDLSGRFVHSVDLTGITSWAPYGETINLTCDGIPTLTGLSAFVDSVKNIPGIFSFRGCGLTDASPFILAIYHGTSTANPEFVIDGNPINESIGINQGSGGSSSLSARNCGLTGLGAFHWTGGNGGSLWLGNAGAALANTFNAISLTADTQTFNSATLDVSNVPSLYSITAGDGSSSGICHANGATITFNGDSLGTASEDGLLDSLVACFVNNGDVGSLDLSGGSNATPDSGGAADVATLVGGGWTVTTN